MKKSSVTEDRDKYIGGSDIPIIMGISTFKKRGELLLEKANLIVSDFKGNKYTKFGNKMEPKIREYMSNEMFTYFEEHVYINEELAVRCNLDGLDHERVLEIKTTSKIKSSVNEYQEYLVQLLFYMHHKQKNDGTLAVYHRTDVDDLVFDHRKLQIHHIEINRYSEMVVQINEEVIKFQKELEEIKNSCPSKREYWIHKYTGKIIKSDMSSSWEAKSSKVSASGNLSSSTKISSSSMLSAGNSNWEEQTSISEKPVSKFDGGQLKKSANNKLKTTKSYSEYLGPNEDEIRELAQKIIDIKTKLESYKTIEDEIEKEKKLVAKCLAANNITSVTLANHSIVIPTETEKPVTYILDKVRLSEENPHIICDYQVESVKPGMKAHVRFTKKK